MISTCKYALYKLVNYYYYYYATCCENGPCCVKNVVAPFLVRINIDSFVALVLRKFPCFLEIDILFILNYKSGTKLAKIYSTGNPMFIPTYNKRTNALVKTLRHCSNMLRSECDLTLSGLRINIKFLWVPQAISRMRYRVENYC